MPCAVSPSVSPDWIYDFINILVDFELSFLALVAICSFSALLCSLSFRFA